MLNNSAIFNNSILSHSIIVDTLIDIYVSNPWHEAVNGIIKGLTIKTSNTHRKNSNEAGFNYLCDYNNRFTVINGVWNYNPSSCQLHVNHRDAVDRAVWLGDHDPMSLNWTDYKIEATLQVNWGYWVGIIFRTQQVSSTTWMGKHYHFSWDFSTDKLYFQITNNGGSTNTLYVHQGPPNVLNVDYKLRVEVNGNQCCFYLDNKFLFTHTDNTFAWGSIGLATHYSEVTFKSLRITFQHNNFTAAPSSNPTHEPTTNPTFNPTNIPTNIPTYIPTYNPTTTTPTYIPSIAPASNPTLILINNPTVYVSPSSNRTLMISTQHEQAFNNDHDEWLDMEIIIVFLTLLILMVFILIIVCICCICYMHKQRENKKVVTQNIQMEVHTVSSISPQLSSTKMKNDTDHDIYSSMNTNGEENQEIIEDESNVMDDKNGFYAKVIVDYVAEDEDQLNLTQDMIVFIMIEYMTESGWWYGMDVNGNDGWIPSNYLMRFNETQKEELQKKENFKLQNELMDQSYRNLNRTIVDMDKYFGMPPKIPPVVKTKFIEGDITLGDSSSDDSGTDNSLYKTVVASAGTKGHK